MSYSQQRILLVGIRSECSSVKVSNSRLSVLLRASSPFFTKVAVAYSHSETSDEDSGGKQVLGKVD